jgi:hypothetical protein
MEVQHGNQDDGDQVQLRREHAAIAGVPQKVEQV